MALRDARVVRKLAPVSYTPVPSETDMVPRIVPSGSIDSENLVGKVCVCSTGRLGLVTGREEVTFGNGDRADCWTGIGFDGRGLWATGANKAVVVMYDSVADFVARIKARPNNLLFGQVAVTLGGN